MGISVINTQHQDIQQYVVLGGTFDPIHDGHLITANALADKLGYDCVHLMPCGDAYHKQGSSSAYHRLAMLELAVRHEAKLQADDQETKRLGATYTVDTLKNIRQSIGPNAHLVWVMGSDAAQSLSSWHNWQMIFTLANVVVVARNDELPADLSDWPAKCFTDINEFKKQPYGGYLLTALPPVAISSTQIRLQVVNQETVDNHVPQSVIDYIEQHGLYRGEN